MKSAVRGERVDEGFSMRNRETRETCKEFPARNCGWRGVSEWGFRGTGGCEGKVGW